MEFAKGQLYELNLRDYWNIIIKRKSIILMSIFVITLITVVYTNFQPLLYRATAVIKIDPTVGLSRIFGAGSYYRWTPSEVPDYLQQIRSSAVIEKAIVDGGLINKAAPRAELNKLISNIMSNLFVSDIEKTNMINISVVSDEPQRAAKIANSIAEAFRLVNIEQKNRTVRNTREFIEKQIQRVSFQLRRSEEKLKAFTLKGVGSMANSILEKITQLESQRINLLTKFTELHPDIIRITREISELKEQLKALPQEEFEFGTLKRDAALNERLYNILRENLQEIQIKESEKIDNVLLINPAIAPKEPFTPNKPRNYSMGIIMGVIFGIFIGLVFEHLDTSIGRIEDLESITGISVVGVIPYYTAKDKEAKEKRYARAKDFFSFRRKNIRKKERTEKLQGKLIAMFSEKSVFLEAFRILGANVQVVVGDSGRIRHKCILVTSSNPQEGKTIVAANLAIIMAQMGYRTVLIDADLRRSSQHNIFGVKKEKGVTDILTGAAALESAVRTVTDLLLGDLSQDSLLKNPWLDNFNLITAGTTFPNSPYLLNTENINGFINGLKDKYDVMIMDSSPVLAVSDTSILVPKVDGVFLVYRAGATSRIALRRAKVQIESAAKSKSALKGIILNNVSPDVSADSYYYYYSRSKYYTEEEKKESS